MGHNGSDLAAVARLGDVALVDGLRGLVQQDRALTARLLLHLGEVEARGLFRDRGFPSMFEYAVEVLHMSPDEAYVRLRAAKLAREFPLVLQMLERNELHLTAIKLLAPHLTQANHVDVLQRARFRSKREVELLVAELAPKPDVPSVVRKLPAPRASARVMPPPAVESAPAALLVHPSAPAGRLSDRVAAAVLSVHSAAPVRRELRLEAPRQVTTPLRPGRYKVQFIATQALHDKLQQLKDLMRHQIPNGDLCAIVERAADLLIEQQMKRRFAQTKNPRSTARDPATRESEASTVRAAAAHGAAPSGGPDAATLEAKRSATRAAATHGSAPSGARVVATLEARRWSRYIPRAVIREVHARDAGQCTFVSSEGRRCAARGRLELHHEDPYARGGLPTVENLKILCRAHNALLAERDFGRAYIRTKRSRVRPREGLGPER